MNLIQHACGHWFDSSEGDCPSCKGEEIPTCIYCGDILDNTDFAPYCSQFCKEDDEKGA